jgi:ATP-dependent Zn protease
MTGRARTRQRATAFHEAGHAVVAWHHGLRFHAVSIIEDQTTLGRLSKLHRPARFDPATAAISTVRRHFEPRIQVSLGGVFAERRGMRRAHNWTGAALDLDSAGEAAMRCTGSDKQATLYLAWLAECTKAIVEMRWPLIERLAEELLVRQTLNRAEVSAIIART